MKIIIKNKIVATLLGLLPILSHAQAITPTNSITVFSQATATLSSSCTISAQNVNFGNLSLPALQSGITSSSNMNVLCTTGSAYTIALAYGGVYGTVNPSADAPQGVGSYSLASINKDSQGNITSYGFNEYSPSGTYVATTNYPTSTPPDTTYNSSTKRYTINSVSYSYGVLTGAGSGDQIQYSISVPGDNTKVWNAGNYTYSNTGTGASQSFPIRATVTGSYPTPDFYTDTVTATVNF